MGERIVKISQLAMKNMVHPDLAYFLDQEFPKGPNRICSFFFVTGGRASSFRDLSMDETAEVPFAE